MVHLRLDLFPLVLLDRRDVDLVVEVADVADDGLVLHGGHVLVADHVAVAGGGHEDVGLVGGVLHGHDLVAFHGGLQGVDRVDFGDPHLRRQRAQRLGRALAHVAVAGHAGHLAGDHHVGGALDAVHQRFAAAVQVVELALGDRVVHVDGAEQQRALGAHLVQAVHAGGRLFGHADDLGRLAGVPGVVHGQLGLDGGVQNAFFFAGRVGEHAQVFFGALAQVHEQRGVAAVVQDHVRAFALRALGTEVEDGVGVVPVVLQRLALDGEHRRAGGGDGGGGVVLRREDVARGPAHFGAQGLQRLDQHGRLDGHVQRARDARALQGLALRELFTDGHQAGHLGFGDLDFLAAPGGKGQVGNRLVGGRDGGGLEYSAHVNSKTGLKDATAYGEERLTARTAGERGCDVVRASRLTALQRSSERRIVVAAARPANRPGHPTSRKARAPARPGRAARATPGNSAGKSALGAP
ncbi:hypothetical protein D3C71_815160 [compost metagenome]